MPKKCSRERRLKRPEERFKMSRDHSPRLTSISQSGKRQVMRVAVKAIELGRREKQVVPDGQKHFQESCRVCRGHHSRHFLSPTLAREGTPIEPRRPIRNAASIGVPAIESVMPECQALELFEEGPDEETCFNYVLQ